MGLMEEIYGETQSCNSRKSWLNLWLDRFWLIFYRQGLQFTAPAPRCRRPPEGGGLAACGLAFDRFACRVRCAWCAFHALNPLAALNYQPN